MTFLVKQFTRNKWLTFCGRPEASKSAALCEDHFTDGYRSKLSVPDRNPPMEVDVFSKQNMHDSNEIPDIESEESDVETSFDKCLQDQMKRSRTTRSKQLDQMKIKIEESENKSSESESSTCSKNKIKDPDLIMKNKLKDLERENTRLELEVEELNQKTIEYDRILKINREFTQEKEKLKREISEAIVKSEKSELNAEKLRRQVEELKVKSMDKTLEVKYNINEKLAEANNSLNKQVNDFKKALREAAKKERADEANFATQLEQKEMNIRTLQYLNDELEKKYENSKKVIESNKEVSKELKKLTSRKAGSNQDNLLTAFKCIALIRQKEEVTGNLDKPKDSSNSSEVRLNDDKLLESNLELNKQVKDLMESVLKQKVEEKQNIAKIEDLQMNIRTLQYLNEELERKYENYKKIVDSNKELARELKKLTSKKGGSHDDFINNVLTLQKQNEEFKKSLLERFEDENLISEIKKFLNPSQLAFLRNPKSQIIEWKSEDVAEAVNLHAYSSEAYNFLKNKGFPLPAESVLKKWTDQQFISNNKDIVAESTSQDETYEQSPKKIKLEPEPSSSDSHLKESDFKIEIKEEMEDVDVESIFYEETIVYTQDIKQEDEVHFTLKEEIQ